MLAELCERRESCRYKETVEKLEQDVQPIFDQKTRDYLWCCLRHLRVSNKTVLTMWYMEHRERRDYRLCVANVRVLNANQRTFKG